jgi:hypothetical protein
MRVEGACGWTWQYKLTSSGMRRASGFRLQALLGVGLELSLMLE